MRATLGDDRSVWRECHSLFPCGTPYGTEDLSPLNAPPRNLDRARAALQAQPATRARRWSSSTRPTSR